MLFFKLHFDTLAMILCVIKVYSGKKSKDINVKTNSKGIFKLNTKNLSKGKHKFSIQLKNQKYNFNKQFYIKIK